MRIAIMAVLLLLASINASADCELGPSGLVCTQPSDCTGTTVWNTLLSQCVQRTCQPGSTSLPLGGGGVICGPAPTCLPGYVFRADLGRCDNPDGAPVDSTIKCSLTIEWAGDAQTAKLTGLTPVQACHEGADLATARVQVQLLGGK